MASVVFEKMFFGHFKEAKMGPGEPILLERVDPAVFDCTMRYVSISIVFSCSAALNSREMVLKNRFVLCLFSLKSTLPYRNQFLC
jgi:hypothetical protein